MALFVFSMVAYVFPVRFTCADGSQRIGSASSVKEAQEMADAVCDYLAKQEESEVATTAE